MKWKDELKKAIKQGDVEKLKTFTVSQLTSMVSLKEDDGRHALGCACYYGGHANSIRQIIIQLGEKAQREACYTEFGGRTPFHSACQWHGVEIVRLMIRVLGDKASKLATKKEMLGHTPQDFFVKSNGYNLDRLIAEVEAEKLKPTPLEIVESYRNKLPDQNEKEKYAEKSLQQWLSETKQGYKSGNLNQHWVFIRYKGLLRHHESNVEDKIMILMARAEFSTDVAIMSEDRQKKQTMLESAAEDYHFILDNNPNQSEALKALVNVQELLKEINSKETSVSVSEIQRLLNPPAVTSSLSETIELNISIQYSELKFDKKLGQGFYGEVYSGTLDHNQVAIKKLLGNDYKQEAIEELQQEAQAIAIVHSDRLVRTIGISIEVPNYFLVIELMPKGNLFNLLQSNKTLEWPLRYQLAQDIGIGLYHLHSANILHRNLNSFNVLLTNDDRARLCDFGLEKIKTSTRKQIRMGQTNVQERMSREAIQWMAPELFGLTPKYSIKSDIYSYGMILWELSARQAPYENVISENELMDFAKSGAHEEIPVDTPPKFASLIKHCWAVKPEKRLELEKIIQELDNCKLDIGI